jgi:ferritin-like metal-binding protein YciE
MKKNLDLNDLLIQKLSALYDIENHLVKALPKMAKAATDQALKEGFRNHLTETRTHVHRLEKAFKVLGEKPKKLKAEAIRGLVKDGEWVIKNVKPEAALDSNLVRAAQYVEHYEMAGYMGAIAWANILGEKEVRDILEETLTEEQNTDRKLMILGRELDKELVG